MNVDSILISDFAQVTAGKLTVVGVFNRIGPTELPTQLGTLAVSLVIHAHHDQAGSTHTGELRLIDETRTALHSLPFEFRFTDEGLVPGIPLRVVQAIVAVGPKFERAGPYAFEVYIDDIYHAAAAFVVVEAG